MDRKISPWWGRIGCWGAALVIFSPFYLQFFNMRREADTAGCLSNLKQIGMGLQQYALDNDGMLPAVDRPALHATWKTDIMPYVKRKSCFLCPARSGSGLCSDGLPISYAANTAGVGRKTENRGPFAPSRKPFKLNDVSTPDQVIAICEVQNTTSPGFDIDDPFFGPGRQVLFAGHVTRSNFLLLDGHATSVFRPSETVPPGVTGSSDSINMWYLDGSKPLSDNGMRILAKTEKVFGGEGH